MISLMNDNALNCYDKWQSPTVIISDGAYGVGGFKGDPRTVIEDSDRYATKFAC